MIKIYCSLLTFVYHLLRFEHNGRYFRQQRLLKKMALYSIFDDIFVIMEKKTSEDFLTF